MGTQIHRGRMKDNRRKADSFMCLFVCTFSGYRPGKREKMNKVIDTTTIGGRLKAKRKEAGYSQEKLAELLMIKQNTLSKYESGDHDVPTDVLSMVAKLLNTTPSYLVWGSAEEEGWLSELNIIAGSIKNPAIREAALKQMLALAQMDAQLK